MSLLDRVRRTIARHALATPETRIVAAVSGGSDSVALLYLLHDLHASRELTLAGVAHFDHQLRDAAADDERFCRELSEPLGLPFVSGRGDVAAHARASRWSIERAARTLRHQFLEQARRQLHADVVAVGHSRDDQAETFLLRLLRGAGSRGLAAMYPQNGRIIRPLLDCGRDELRGDLAVRGIGYREDDTNQDVTIPRNRIRHELIPLLRDRFNPAIVDRLADAADVARDEHAYLMARADEWLASHGHRDGAAWRLDRSALVGAPIPIARLAIWRALSATPATTPVFADVERVLELARGTRGSFDASRQRVQLIRGEVVLRGRAADERGRPRPQPGSPVSAYTLSIPGEVLLPESGYSVSAEIVPSAAQCESRLNCVAVRVDKTNGGFQVRYRRAGDRFRPAGSPGRKKLQDFFVDRKVDREQRDRIPIVVDADDRIVWVAGHAVDEAFRVQDPAQAVIILRLKGVGGSV